MARPNILLLMSDQHNAKCLGCYGHPVVQTPNLDRLSRRGVRFTSAFVQSPICTPSRVSGLTAQYPHNHGYFGLKGPTPPQLPNLFAQLKASGYYTGAIGKVHLPDEWIEPHCHFFCEGAHGRARARESYQSFLLRHGIAEGDDEVTRRRMAQGLFWQSVDGRPDFLPKELSHDGYAVQMAREFFRTRPPGWPFFLWFTLSKPHEEYKPAREFWDLYHEPLPLPPSADDEPVQKLLPLRRAVAKDRSQPPADLEPGDYESLRQRKLHGYFGNISHMDWAMGQVLELLEDERLNRNTLILYTADHGEFACEHGLLEKAPGVASDAVARVPLIWSWWDQIPENRVRRQLVESIDLWPTLAAMADLPSMAMWDGLDHSDIVLRDGPPVRDAAYTENPFIKAITTPRWRLTYVPAEMFPGDPVRGELYDREADPWERANLYHEPALAPVVAELRDKLLDWLVTTAHPVTAWPVAPHPSMPDGFSTPHGGSGPYPEDGRTSPNQIRKAIQEGKDDYL